jgi:hypothetical protein
LKTSKNHIFFRILILILVFSGKKIASEKKGEVNNILNIKPMTPVVENCGCLANSCGFKSLIGPGR